MCRDRKTAGSQEEQEWLIKNAENIKWIDFNSSVGNMNINYTYADNMPKYFISFHLKRKHISLAPTVV